MAFNELTARIGGGGIQLVDPSDMTICDRHTTYCMFRNASIGFKLCTGMASANTVTDSTWFTYNIQ